VWQAVQRLERAGAAAIQIEDQTFPRRCGHFDGRTVVSVGEMVEKICAAMDARQDPDLLIIARTDANEQHGIASACARANAYVAAGADMVFVESPTTVEQIETIAREVEAPAILNIVEGGKTPDLTIERIRELGVAIALYANLPLLASLRATHEALVHLRHGRTDDARRGLATWTERQRIVGLDRLQALDAAIGETSRSILRTVGEAAFDTPGGEGRSS
jgi:2-methylisocitrate lyase-like PEP mutase family enzyme